MAYASTDDVAVELGRPATSADESVQWERWLEKVERAIERRFAREGYDLAEQVAASQPSVEDVRDVEVARVADKARHPDSRQSSFTRSIDDASVTNRFEGVTGAVDLLALTEEEWAALLPARHRGHGAFSVMPS